MTGISIIVPTTGRRSLRATLDSLAAQTKRCDFVYIVHDSMGASGLDGQLAGLSAEWPGAWRYVLTGQVYGDWGHTPSNHVLEQIPEGEPVWRLDDDDVAQPGALDAIRQGVDENPGRVLCFKMIYGPGHLAHGLTLWHTPRMRHGEIGTPMIVSPRGSARYGQNDYSGDWMYAEECVAQHGQPVFIDQVIALIRPEVSSR